MVLLLVGASAVVFAQFSAPRQSQGPSKNPLAGKWVPVLKGFTLTSLVAADSTPVICQIKNDVCQITCHAA